jgi:uncharacterized membrane protein
MKLSVRQIVISGLLGAIAIVLGVTRLGFIGPIPPLGLSITILAIPVIIGGVLEGPLVGLLVGLVFGLSSWLQAPTEAPPGNLWFSNPAGVRAAPAVYRRDRGVHLPGAT